MLSLYDECSGFVELLPSTCLSFLLCLGYSKPFQSDPHESVVVFSMGVSASVSLCAKVQSGLFTLSMLFSDLLSLDWRIPRWIL
jgi:hypothetical protein